MNKMVICLVVLTLILSAPCAQASKGQVTADRYVGNEAEIGPVTINQSGLSVDVVKVINSINLTADRKIYFGDTFSIYYDSANERLVVRSEPDDADLIYINVPPVNVNRVTEFPTPVRLNDGVMLLFGTGEDFYIKYDSSADALFIMSSTGGGIMIDSSGKVTLSGDLDMYGNDIVNAADITPKDDNVSAIGSPSLRYNAIYSYAVYTGDLKFANGWVLTEAENLGLGKGIVLVSPDGEVYGVGELKYLGNKGVPLTHAVTYAVMGLLAGLGIGAGAVMVNKKLRK